MKYKTIVADPPWRYSTSGVRTENPNGGSSKMVSGHYDTMTIREMCEINVSEMADDNAHLYLWVTNPRLYGENKHSGGRDLLPIDLIEAWGFEYQTCLTWLKTGAPGMGFYFRGQTEHVLFATRGRCPVDESKRIPNFFLAPRGRHSEKPDTFLDLVEQVSPGPYLEMFSRRARFSWDTWGNEALNHVEITAGGNDA